MGRNRNLLARSAVFTAIALGIALGGCKSEQKSESDGSAEGMKTAAVNTVCPVSQRAVNAGAPTRQFQGKTVGFCCQNCPNAWDKKTVAERDAMMAKIAAK